MRATSQVKLLVTSFLTLYFELLIIRYLSTEIRTFAYLKNLPLIASFLGIGLGMIIGKPKEWLLRAFPFIACAFFMIVRFAEPLGLTHIGLSGSDYFVWGSYLRIGPAPIRALVYLAMVIPIVAMIVGFFTVLGGLVGEHLKGLAPLPGYGVNLAGSLAGVAVFTLLSFFSMSPVWWVFIGFLFLAPFFYRRPLALALFTIVIVATWHPSTHIWWSPYYRIDLFPYLAAQVSDAPFGYRLTVNHDFHQDIIDLSPAFMAKHPDQEPSRSGFPNYELPYRLVGNPGNVLIVGAGTGNDVAAALRHGAAHVDAVEIDSVIQRIGSIYHPEHPYSSRRVSVHINDARAFLKTTRERYDVIVFGYLDAHTLISSFSSLRLDNYVYTLESFREAKNLLSANGTMIISFGSGAPFITNRMYATLEEAFGAPPTTYLTGYGGSGVVFVEGAGSSHSISDLPKYNPKPDLIANTIIATDRWPFLYLSGRRIPLAIIVVLAAFVCCTWLLLKKVGAIPWHSHRHNLHFLFLGAGFLLLETKGVTDLALLFGSTWLVNAIVIAVFLVMAIAANALATARSVPHRPIFLILFVVLGVGLFVPYSFLNGASTAWKIMGSALFIGMPVFLSSLIFSGAFRRVAAPSEALGVNLLGAMIGGMLENLVMIGGTAFLGVIAILLYLSASWFFQTSGDVSVSQPAYRPV